jgi:hypothetical protein
VAERRSRATTSSRPGPPADSTSGLAAAFAQAAESLRATSGSTG